MSIGFDLDKIFIDHPKYVSDKIVEKIIKQKSNVLSYRIPSKPEQPFYKFTHLTLFRPAIQENLDFIEHLAQRPENKYYLISGRFGFLKKATEDLTKKYHFSKIFDTMFFNFNNKQPHIFKDQILKKLNLDKYIDDDLDLLKYIAPKHPKTNFYWLNNKSSIQLEKNLFAITKIRNILDE